MSRGSRAPGTTSPPTCRSRRFAAAPPGHPPADRAGRPRAALPDGADRAGGQPASARSRSRSRSATRTGSTGRARSTGRIGSSGARYAGPHLLQVRGRQPGRQPQAEHGPRRRPSTTRRRASPGSRPRPAPGSGGARWRSRAPTSGSRSRSTWSAPATTRSRTGGS